MTGPDARPMADAQEETLDRLRTFLTWVPHPYEKEARAALDSLANDLARHAQTVEALALLKEAAKDTDGLPTREALALVICSVTAEKPPEHVFEYFRKLHGLAADTDSQAPEARLDPRRFSARYSDRVAKIEGGLPMERG